VEGTLSLPHLKNLVAEIKTPSWALTLNPSFPLITPNPVPNVKTLPLGDPSTPKGWEGTQFQRESSLGKELSL